MSQQQPPAGYAVVQLDDKQWYPLLVERWYGPDVPEEGCPFPRVMDYSTPVRYPRRDQALAHCHRSASEEARKEQEAWMKDALQQERDQQSGRIPYYLDVIQQITGKPPTVNVWSDGTLEVDSHLYICAFCKRRGYGGFILAWTGTLEEALAQSAEQIYAEHGHCAERIEHQQAS